MAVIYTKHAKEMLLLRGIKQKSINDCVKNPDKIEDADNGRQIYLKDHGRIYLKVVLARDGKNFVIITAHWLDKKRVAK